jgi:hypothetical protein
VNRLTQIVVDSRHPAALARFWDAVLDEFRIGAYDDEEVARLASFGRTPETDPCVILEGPSVEICFQEIDEPTTTKRPLHLDIDVSDRAAETARLVDLGATIVQVFEAHTWMRDPEGNDFCLTDED